MSFQDREKAFEDKFSHDSELQFRVEVRRNKLLGLWVAEMLGLKGEEADAYARDVISSDFEEAGDDDVVRKVLGDLKARDIELSEHRLRKKMDELRDVAKRQVMTE
ncbi:hypothetical protein SAMN06265365_13532 [Tistlia consotensis]|uniref:Aldolase n=1 Tax=Tistlia consotensis USBA 355 TaxID=560819 RepID=A0A1Y6CPP3_9PROT|nr:DUF1476 domain-containing protein [Tistlia consotensis]SMF79551.1 hypothetical protein SAMN05428998_14019 [Tistlia consotensis USBA 355]SNS16995.1 hypothetical protein SAMN06265365_13532 [Tistlia consotensis]